MERGLTAPRSSERGSGGRDSFLQAVDGLGMPRTPHHEVQHSCFPRGAWALGVPRASGSSNITSQQGEQGGRSASGLVVSHPQVSEALSLGSHQLHRMQVGSHRERPGAARWTSLTLAPATTAPARTSTAWCLRRTCSWPLTSDGTTECQGQLGVGP